MALPSLIPYRARCSAHLAPEAMACLHETRTPSPSFGGFVSTLSEASMRKLDPDTSDCTPEKDLTPTQCVLRDVVPLGGQGGGGPSPSPGGEPPPEPFANSVLQLHEQDTGGPGGATGSPESRASRVRADEVRLQCQSGSGFLEGLFGCLRPVWTMIGKAYSTEHKQQQEGRPDPCRNPFYFPQQSYQTCQPPNHNQFYFPLLLFLVLGLNKHYILDKYFTAQLNPQLFSILSHCAGKLNPGT